MVSLEPQGAEPSGTKEGVLLSFPRGLPLVPRFGLVGRSAWGVTSGTPVGPRNLRRQFSQSEVAERALLG